MGVGTEETRKREAKIDRELISNRRLRDIDDLQCSASLSVNHDTHPARLQRNISPTPFSTPRNFPFHVPRATTLKPSVPPSRGAGAREVRLSRRGFQPTFVLAPWILITDDCSARSLRPRTIHKACYLTVLFPFFLPLFLLLLLLFSPPSFHGQPASRRCRAIEHGLKARLSLSLVAIRARDRTIACHAISDNLSSWFFELASEKMKLRWKLGWGGGWTWPFPRSRRTFTRQTFAQGGDQGRWERIIQRS